VRPLLAVLLTLLLFAAPARAGTVEYDYVTVSDGTEIAVSIWYPDAYEPGAGRRWPVLFEMDGYGGARNVNDKQFHGRTQEFIVVFASIRGTGCSGGRFALFGDQGALDGHEIIEDWIVEQPWSNGRVGITGHSYSGLTGFQVASTNPPHVEAVAVSGLIDDFYRGILYFGGVPNAGFPLAWGAAARPALELQANAQHQALDERCRANVLEHEGSDYVPPPQLLFDTYGSPYATEDSWAIRQGLMRRVREVRAPTQIGHQWQDEQTGPRGGPVLWQHLRPGLPKRLVLSNGRHNPNDPTQTKDDWLRCWVIRDGKACGHVTEPKRRVLWHLDSRRGGDAGQQRATPHATRTFPDPRTRWQRWALEPRSYVSATTDQHVTANTGIALSEEQGLGAITFARDAPNQATWRLAFDRDRALAGPIAMTLRASVTAADTDFFVDVLDRDTTTGELRYLQRGMLRASLRRVDPQRSDRVRSGPHRGAIWRPHHSFVDPQPLTPGEPTTFEIEIYPVAHVFRAGHELVLQLHAPPPNDPLSINTHLPAGTPALVETLAGSSVLLPFLETVPKGFARPASCAEIAGELCIQPAG
jgi:predicted acyl esterase